MYAGTARRVLRYEIPVDGNSHTIETDPSNPVVHVATRRPGRVDIWIEVRENQPKTERAFHVYATGELIQPAEGHIADYMGTVVTDGGHFVWHVYETI